MNYIYFDIQTGVLQVPLIVDSDSRGSSEEKLNYIQEIINLCGNNLPVCLVQ